MFDLCRDCLADLPAGLDLCSSCGSRRIVSHPELHQLFIVHLDADAFYASIEKRDNPSLLEMPLIVGGSRQRGVVLTACYVARKFGVKSAMPMFQALRLCPQAVVVPPDMTKYAGVARLIRDIMLHATPLVEPLSLDEAYLDLTGTERLHGASAAKTVARLVNEIENTVGISVSAGLSYNKFLAKLASDLDKPRGFAIIGRAEAKVFLRDKPVGTIRGVGPVLSAKLAGDGFQHIGQLQDCDERDLVHRYGDTGAWLHRLANGEDNRFVQANGEAKSISAETTFEEDISHEAELERVLWDQTERVSKRAKSAGLGGRTITLKLKTANFRIKTRSASLEHPTQLAHVIFSVGRKLLSPEVTRTKYRLLGIGLSQLCPAEQCDPVDVLDQKMARRTSVEKAMDQVRAKFGDAAVRKGGSVAD